MENTYDNLDGSYDLYEESWNLLGHLIEQKECGNTIRSLSDDEVLLNEADEFFDEFDSNNYRRIQRFLLREKRRTLIKRVIPQMLKGVVAAVGILSIAIGIAVASSATFRSYLTKLMIEAAPEYTTLWIEKSTTTSSKIPDGWNGKHFPTVIPAGLVIGQVFSDGEESFVTFCKPEGEITFSFYEIDKGVINIDTEGTEIKEVSINGIVGHAVLKADSIRIFWLYEDSLLMISMNHGSLEEAIFFAESVDHIS